MLRAMRKPNDCERDFHMPAALGFREVSQKQWQLHVALGGEDRQQII